LIPVARRDAHPLEREQTARVKDWSEENVVDLGELVVHALDEVVFDGDDR
jgi:hypothetical protein